MMKPYMGAYGIMRSPLNQPYNLELQIYRETHGISQLESKQWGIVYWVSSDMETKFTFPIEFSEGMISAVAADTGGGSQGFGIHPIDTKSADIYRSGEGYNGSCRLVLIGKQTVGSF